MLECRSLRFQYPEILIEADFQVAAGQSVALMGQSGSGKTTILNLIAGFIEPDAGDIRFEGRSLLGVKPADRPLTYLFQAHNLFPHLSVWQNLALGIDPGLKLDAADRQRVERALGWVSLEGFDSRLPGQLSGGQQQRVALARCLLRQKPILLLDEPFTALDSGLRDEMIALVLTLQSERNLALVLSTHEPADCSALGADVVRIGEPAKRI